MLRRMKSPFALPFALFIFSVSSVATLGCGSSSDDGGSGVDSGLLDTGKLSDTSGADTSKADTASDETADTNKAETTTTDSAKDDTTTSSDTSDDVVTDTAKDDTGSTKDTATGCKTACDCSPGLGCVSGKCISELLPVYCCEGSCPAGAQCQHGGDGSMSHCP